jgi:hypothetical protein
MEVIMKRTLSFSVSIAILAAVAGCSNTQKSNTLRAAELTPKAHAVPTVADLEVADKKVLGQAKGKTVSKHDLEQEAIAEALKPVNADVLVGVGYFYEENGKDLTVTVVGYPARYKNFRPKEVPKADVLIGGNFFYEDGNNNLSVTVKNVKPDDAPQEPVAEQKPHEIPVIPAVPSHIPAAVPSHEGHIQ